jgi:CO/xanthine dehydrogenase Mo-binding subunit
MEPIMDKAARKLGIDRLALRRINAPDENGKGGHERHGLTSAYQREALDKGAELFGWEALKKQSGSKKGSKVIGVGIGQAFHQGGFRGMDGMVRITPDGRSTFIPASATSALTPMPAPAGSPPRRWASNGRTA